MNEYTVNELVNEAIKRADEFRSNTADSGAARDYSLAITHLEDGLTRFNSAQYRLAGTWNRRDPERG